MRRLLVVLSSAGVLLVGSAPIAGAAAPYCRSGQAPQFVFGFAALAQAGAPMGTALECEHANPANGDTLQQTSTGLRPSPCRRRRSRCSRSWHTSSR